MGSRDFAAREKKKAKKDSKKPNNISASFEAPRPEVEVIKKGKKAKDFEEQRTKRANAKFALLILQYIWKQ